MVFLVRHRCLHARGSARAFAAARRLLARLLLGLGLAAAVGGSWTMPASANVPAGRVLVGAEILAANGFSSLAGKRVGLIANQTSLVDGSHLADLLRTAPGVTLAAILAPEHGFRGIAEAGVSVSNTVDAKTGVPVMSLYGRNRKPTPSMLRGIDVLLFDVQDVGARFYTYISTLGLAMQAAAAATIPFIVPDRPNPLGGQSVAGFVLETSLRSFVGQYPIPIVHGLTVGELARMIKGEGWLDGLEALDLEVVRLQNWQRSMRWPETHLSWVPTSPNIPTFQAALLYPGIGFVGEMNVNEGRGTSSPFTVLGAPWIKTPRLLERLAARPLPGIRFEAACYVPKSIEGVAKHPRFLGEEVNGARLIVTDPALVEPLEVGMYVLAALADEARAAGQRRLIANVAMFHALAGTKRIHRLLLAGSDGGAVIEAWRSEVDAFRAQRSKYLLY